MRSGAIGGLIARTGCRVVLSLRQAQLREAVSELASGGQRATAPRGEAQNRLARRLNHRQQAGRSFVAVPCSPGFRRWPRSYGLQLTTAVVSGRELSFQGEGSDPNGFIRSMRCSWVCSARHCLWLMRSSDARRLNPGQAEPSGSIHFGSRPALVSRCSRRMNSIAGSGCRHGPSPGGEAEGAAKTNFQPQEAHRFA